MTSGPNSLDQRYPVGIDLGTTYSIVAYLDEDHKPVAIPNSLGELLTPSALFFEEDNLVVGRDAVKAAAFRPDRFIECFKRHMGDGTTAAIAGVDVPHEVFSGMLLARLKQDAEERIGPIKHVVITVPAYFDEARRQSTVLAAKLAHLEVLDIINEPTAAAVTYGYGLQKRNQAEQGTILVYDLGGGTFDVTILRLNGNEYNSVATDGDVQLGGKDFDERLIHFLADQFLQQHGFDPRTNMNDYAQLWLDAEEIKRGLSHRQKMTHVLFHAGLRLKIEITREKFEELTADLLARTRSTTSLVLKEAHLTWDDIDDVLIVGGSGRMPMVPEMLKELSGKDPNTSSDPDLAVGYGAAIVAGSIMSGGQSNVRLTNVNSHSLGVIGIDLRTKRRVNAIVIPRNTPIPFRVARKCVTARDDQKAVSVTIVEGESTRPEKCNVLGECRVTDLPPGLPKGTEVLVELAYDSAGRISVAARIPSTRQSATTVIERRHQLEFGTLDEWLSKLIGVHEAEGQASHVMRKLDEAMQKIADLVLVHNEAEHFAATKQRIKQLKSERDKLLGQKTDLEHKQLKSRNRLEATQHSSALADLENRIRALEIEFDFARIQLGREVVAAANSFQIPVAHPLDPETQSLVAHATELTSQLQ